MTSRKEDIDVKIIGYRYSSFNTEDGKTIKGYNLFLTEPCEKGEGLSCERVYVQEKYLNECGYAPKCGDEVTLTYNRYGKCNGVVLVSPGK